jgi:hypothetical protein
VFLYLFWLNFSAILDESPLPLYTIEPLNLILPFNLPTWFKLKMSFASIELFIAAFYKIWEPLVLLRLMLLMLLVTMARMFVLNYISISVTIPTSYLS